MKKMLPETDETVTVQACDVRTAESPVSFDVAYEAWLLLGLDPEEALWAAAVGPEPVLVLDDSSRCGERDEASPTPTSAYECCV